MDQAITGKTKVLGIIGWPVEHSLSPLMQNAALAAAGLDYAYVPFAVLPERLADAISGMRSLNIDGFNVTIPHKTSIIPLLDEVTPEAALIGAVNAVRREGDRLVGYNTDGIGFLVSLKRDLGFDPRGSQVLILGAGGAARAAVAALCSAGAASVTVANRSQERSHLLVGRVRPHYPSVILSSSPLDILQNREILSRIDLLVNTTSVGMKGTSFPVFDPALLGKEACVYDMVYVPAETVLLAEARKSGHRCANGIGMLVAQGEEAFRIWTGMATPPGIMADALVQARKG